MSGRVVRTLERVISDDERTASGDCTATHDALQAIGVEVRSLVDHWERGQGVRIRIVVEVEFET